MGRFAGLASRWLYFLSGLMLTAAIATGLILWTAKRCRPHGFGHALVDRLNMGFVAGMPAAFAIFLIANRLLPVDLVMRAEIEIRCLFMAWGAALLFAALRRRARAWRELLGVAAIACAAIPLADLSAARLPGGPAALDGVALGVDAVALALAALLAASAWLVHRHAKP
jgi:hypothetical protein